MEPLRVIISPVSEGSFADKFDFSKVPSITEGIQLRILSAASKTPPGDYRDWDAVRTWALGLNSLLKAA